MQNMHSNSQPKKINLKIQSHDKTKRVRDVPASFDALKKTVEALISDQRDAQQLEKSMQGGIRDYSIRYIDSEQELINVSDDEDLLTAYEVAEHEMSGNIKFIVDFKKAIVSEAKPIAEKAHEETPSKKDKKKLKKATKRSNLKKNKHEEEEKEFVVVEEGDGQNLSALINNTEERLRANTANQPQCEKLTNAEKSEDEADNPDSSEEECPRRKGKKHCKKEAKKAGLPPRKALKRLIQRELDRQAPEIFQQLASCKELGQSASSASEPINTNLATHSHVECDGCGVHPIIGIRYKCCVCKNFDYCELCEDRLQHPHPFIKIQNPNDVPATIVTVAYEDEAQPQPQPGCQQQPPHHQRHEHPRRCGRFQRGPWTHGQPTPDQPRGGCHRGGNWRGQNWRNVADHFLNIAGQYIDQFTGEQKEEEKKDGQPTAGHCPWKEGQPTEGHCPWKKWGEGRSQWGEKRAIVLSKHDEVIEVEPGQVTLVEIEVQNGTKWPWKRGCTIGLSQKETTCPIKVPIIPIDQEVRGLQTIKISIPLEIPEAFDMEGKEYYEVELAFYGPKGNTFGQTVTIKIKISEGAQELKLYKAAINLAEAGLGSFDECVEALRKCNCDENAACQMLIEIPKTEVTEDLYH